MMSTEKLSRVFWVALAATILAAYLLPMAYSACISFSSDYGGVANLTLQWYFEILDNERLRGAVFRSLSASVAIALLTTATCMLAVANLRQQPVKIRRALIALILLPLFVPETTHALTLADGLATIGLAKGWPALIVSVAVYITPFTSIVMLLSTADIPQNLNLAARDMGLRLGARMVAVTIPLMWTTCLFAFLFSFILTFNEYARTAYFEDKEMYSVYLRGNLAGGGSQAIYAVSTIMSVLGLFILLGLLYRQARIRDSGAGGQ